MATVLAHAQVIMAEAAIDSRSKAEDHAETKFRTLDKRRDAQEEIVGSSEQTQAELDRDIVELKDKADNKILGFISFSHRHKIEKLGNELAESQAVAEAATQTTDVIHEDQQALFEDVKKASERALTAKGYVKETLRAVDKADDEGGLS